MGDLDDSLISGGLACFLIFLAGSDNLNVGVWLACL
jgi:hypothetical protein